MKASINNFEGDILEKPKWLKKLHKDKPWKYKYTIQSGKDKGLVIEPYNFTTQIGFDCDEIEKACDWIDEQMKKGEVKK